VGWTTRLHTIRSPEKLTAGGGSLLDVQIVRVLEEDLPRAFGGSAADYQIVEDEDSAGRPRIRLLVAPDVGDLDAPAEPSTCSPGCGKLAIPSRWNAARRTPRRVARSCTSTEPPRGRDSDGSICTLGAQTAADRGKLAGTHIDLRLAQLRTTIERSRGEMTNGRPALRGRARS
jgi:hypothetical protein